MVSQVGVKKGFWANVGRGLKLLSVGFVSGIIVGLLYLVAWLFLAAGLINIAITIYVLAFIAQIPLSGYFARVFWGWR
jgi:multisubunit Na+/H+ antiporter MnhF subunit